MEAIERFMAAAGAPDEASIAALAPWLAEDVSIAGPIAPGTGKTHLMEALAAPNATRFIAGARWTEPSAEGGEVVVDALLPAGAALAGLRFALTVGQDGRIARIQQQLLPAPRPEPSPIAISEELQAMIDGALTNGTPIVVSYVDARGVPHISPRGSVQVLNERQVALWARDPEGGILAGIAANPHIAMYYRDPKTRSAITMTGRATIVRDGPVRDRVYENQPALERNFDGRKRGIAIVVDLDEVETAGPSGRARMVREG
jgi:hypothetical protein